MQQSILGFSLLVITGLVSYRGFKDFEFRERYLFWTDGILVILGILFVGISIVGMKADADNIGHDAHLGGGITGVLMALFYDPSVALENWWMVALILVPSLFFLYRIYSDYTFMLIPGFGNKTQSKPRHEPGEATVRQMKQLGFSKPPSLDFLLDKINAEGIDILSTKERKALEEYQKNL
jgi:hypothetical protein